MYGGRIEENRANNGAGVAVNGSNVSHSYFNMYGGRIANNKSHNNGGAGGGITAGWAEIHLSGGVVIEGNSANRGGGIYVGASTITIENISVINNQSNDSSTNNFGAGICAFNSVNMNISGRVIITGNTHQSDGRTDNLWFNNNLYCSITGDLKDSTIGVSTRNAPTVDSPKIIADGGTNEISDADWGCFFSDKEGYKIVKEGNKLNLYPLSDCDLSGLDLTAERAELEPNFQADETNYTVTVGNDVDSIDITATTASGADITIKINDGTVAAMESGKPKTVDLDEGENTIVITVTSGGKSKEYTI